jgi:hypothetical protein
LNLRPLRPELWSTQALTSLNDISAGRRGPLKAALRI